MTDREYLLAAVLAPQPVHEPVLVLKGEGQEMADRWTAGSRLHPSARLAEGTNTWEEATHAAATAGMHLTIVTSAYHQLRAFLTFIQALHIAGKLTAVRLWNHSVLSSLALLEEEFHKIGIYQRRGQVATYAAGVAYLTWRNTP